VQWLIAALDERVGSHAGRAALHDRLDLIEDEVRHTGRALGESLLDRRLASLSGAEGLRLPGDTASFLNWAEGPEGPAARAGLWFNPPVPVRYAHDAVSVLLVNERVIEQPYVFGALAHLPPPARILDLGGAESTLALSLASIGHHVVVVDPRGYALEHPGLQAHAVRLDELPQSEAGFNAAVALSSIEHFGLGSYGVGRRELRLDRAALADLRERLAPGGVLVLTAPCAAVSTQDDFQRIYAVAEIREMLADWELIDLSVAWREDQFTWVRGDPEQPRGDVGVALVTARRQDAGRPL
jgi:hypothetical protein